MRASLSVFGKFFILSGGGGGGGKRTSEPLKKIWNLCSVYLIKIDGNNFKC